MKNTASNTSTKPLNEATRNGGPGPCAARRQYVPPHRMSMLSVSRAIEITRINVKDAWVQRGRGGGGLHNTCFLGGSQTREQNQKWRPHPCLLGGPHVGAIAPYALHSRGSPNKGIKSEVVASPLPSRGPTRGCNCSVRPAFSGVAKQGNKIRSGCLTPAFSGAHTWVELLHTPCILGGPQTRGHLKGPCQNVGGHHTMRTNQKGCTRRRIGYTIPVGRKRNHNWPGNGRIRYITPTIGGGGGLHVRPSG